MTERQFADMFAIAQVAPGPNVMMVTLVGYHVAGFWARWSPRSRCAGRPPCLRCI